VCSKTKNIHSKKGMMKILHYYRQVDVPTLLLSSLREEIKTHCRTMDDDDDTADVMLVPDLQMIMEYYYNIQPSVSDSGVE
jgi:hypothetical protein